MSWMNSAEFVAESISVLCSSRRSAFCILGCPPRRVWGCRTRVKGRWTTKCAGRRRSLPNVVTVYPYSSLSPPLLSCLRRRQDRHVWKGSLDSGPPNMCRVNVIPLCVDKSVSAKMLGLTGCGDRIPILLRSLVICMISLP